MTTLEDATLEILKLAGRGNPVDIQDLSFWLRQDKHIFIPSALSEILDRYQDEGLIRRNARTATYLHDRGCIEHARSEAWQRGFYFSEKDGHLHLCCRVTDRICHRVMFGSLCKPGHYYGLLRAAGLYVEEV